MPQLPFVSLFLETSQGNSEATTLPPPPHARRMRQPALGRDPGARPGDCESAAGARGPAGAGLSHNGQVSSPPTSNVSLRESRKRSRATLGSFEGLGGGGERNGWPFRARAQFGRARFFLCDEKSI